MSAGVRIAVGERIRWQHGLLDILTVSPTTIGVRKVETATTASFTMEELLKLPGLRNLRSESEDDGLALSELLAAVPRVELERARARERELLEAVTGYRSGDPSNARSREPRPKYDPDRDLSRNLTDRLASKAEDLLHQDFEGKPPSARTLRRWHDKYKEFGLLGLCDERYRTSPGAAPEQQAEFLRALDEELLELVDASNKTRRLLRRRVHRNLRNKYGKEAVGLASEVAHLPPEARVVVPSETVFYKLVETRTRAQQTFASAKSRRSIHNRPHPAKSPMRARRSGEILQLDSTRLDVLCIHPVSGDFVRPDLMVAIDAYDKCIRAMRVVVRDGKGVDAALLLYDAITPEPVRSTWPSGATWPYGGVPATVVSGCFKDLLGSKPPAAKPIDTPGTVVIDHGKIYRSHVFMAACLELGISVQPTPPGTPVGKPVVERFFDGLGTGFLSYLKGHTGRSVYERGTSVEGEAIWTTDEIHDLLMDWIVNVYHQDQHDGCSLDCLPKLKLSPNAMYEESLRRGGFIVAPPRPDAIYRFLPTEKRLIQHYGVDLGGLMYDGDALDPWRNRRSGTRGAGEKYAIHYDPRNLSTVWFQDPDRHTWHPLTRAAASPETISLPFNAQSLRFAKQLAAERGLPKRDRGGLNDALDELLDRWENGVTHSDLEERLHADAVVQARTAQAEGAKYGLADPDDPDVLANARDDGDETSKPGKRRPIREDDISLPVADGPDPEQEAGLDDEPFDFDVDGVPAMESYE